MTMQPREQRAGVASVLVHLILVLIICSSHSYVQLMTVVRAGALEQHVAAPAPMSTITTLEDQRQALPEDVMMKIEATKLLLQDSAMLALLTTNASSSNNITSSNISAACAPARFDAISEALNSVGGFLLADLVSEASHQVGAAASGFFACQSALAHHDLQQAPTVDNATNSREDSKASILGQAISLLQAASLSLNKLESLPDMQLPVVENSIAESKAIGGCRRDGTACQFSSCGQGRNLPMCAMGFAFGVTGGAAGFHYIVTRDDDNPIQPQPGSLRFAVGLGGGTRGGVWITFDHNMIIQLKSMLWIRSFTTIDGRGANVIINGQLIAVRAVTNVILHNFQINSVPGTDTVHIFVGSTKVWVDHVTSFDAIRGLISVVQKSTDVTISNCKLSNENFNMLLGASDTDVVDKNMRVTIYRNWFTNSRQRMPHCRWGFCHVINNLYTNWGYYAIGGRVFAKILSEQNAFIAGQTQEVTPWFPGANNDPKFDGSALIISHNDLFLNGATFHQFGSLNFVPPYPSTSSYPPLLPNIQALQDFVGTCSGAIFNPSRVQQCLNLAGVS